MWSRARRRCRRSAPRSAPTARPAPAPGSCQRPPHAFSQNRFGVGIPGVLVVNDRFHEALHHRRNRQIDLGTRLGASVRLDGTHISVGVVLCRGCPPADNRLHRLQPALTLVRHAQGSDTVLGYVESGKSLLDSGVWLELPLPLIGWVVVNVSGVAVAAPCVLSMITLFSMRK